MSEALRLADVLDSGENFYAESSLQFDCNLAETVGDAAAELRRLHALNAELVEALRRCRAMVGHPDNIAWIDEALAKVEASK